MDMFSNLTNDGLEAQKDSIGGFSLLDSGVYESTIKLAYAGVSKGGAKCVHLLFDISGKEYQETVYVTNKLGKNFYMNGDKKVPLPGFNLIDSICVLTTNTPLSKQDIQEKVVKIYDYEERKEVPQNVPVLVELLNKSISIAILKQVENKNALQHDGSYAPTEEERELNIIDKVFQSDTLLTTTELNNGLTEGEFIIKWSDKNKGTILDKRKLKGKKTKENTTSSGSVPSKPTVRSLFGSK